MALSQSLLFSTLKITGIMKLLTTQDNKYLLWINEVTEMKTGQTVVSGNIALKLGWNYGFHSLVTKEDVAHFKELKELMGKFPSETTKTVITEVVEAYFPLTPDAAPLDGVPLLPPIPEQTFNWREFLLKKAEASEVTDYLGTSYVTLGTAEWACKQVEKAASGERKYSEEDLRRAFEAGGEPEKLPGGVHTGYKLKYSSWEDYKGSLSPAAPLPVAFEPEWECEDMSAFEDENGLAEGGTYPHTPEWTHKTITLPNGQEQLVGRYKYKEDT